MEHWEAGRPPHAGGVTAGAPVEAGSLGEMESRLKVIVDTALTALVTMDEAGCVVDWNPKAEETFGWSRHEAMGRPLSELIIPAGHREAHERGLRNYLATGVGPVLNRVLSVSAVRRDGTEFPVELAVSPAWRSGDHVLFIAFVRDLTAQRRIEGLRQMQFAVTRALNVGDQLDPVLMHVLDSVAHCLGFEAANVWLCDNAQTEASWRLGWADRSSPLAVFQALSGVTVMQAGAEIPGAVVAGGRPITVGDVSAFPGFARRAAAVRTGLRSAAAFPLIVGRRVSGVMEFLSQHSITLDEDQLAVMADLGAQVGQFVERMRAEDALRASLDRLGEIAATDPLTGLRNRREFERLLSTIPRRRFALLAVDVDNLKRVNDEFGHEAGDVVLRAVALTLSSVVRGWDVVARLGGDEFGAVLLDVDDAEAAEAAERVRSAMHSIAVPFGQARVSVGWAAAPAGADPHAIWRVADGHLFRAKRTGRDRSSGGKSSASRLTHAPAGSRWSELVDDALSTRRLRTMFQPVVNLEDRRVIGHEALARPSGCSPRDSVSLFFSAAQRMGRTRDIDWVCRRLAVERAPWGVDQDWLLFINVSTMALLDPVHLVDQMLLLLRSAGGSPEQVVLEITETELVSDPDRLRLVLAAYREHGFRFAVDDVGEGHSTLELLAAAKPEFIKIARSLSTTASRSGSRAAIRAAVAFARDTDAAVLAEGIETDVIADQVMEMGVVLGQGFLLGEPTRAEAVRDGLRHGVS